MRVSPVLMCQCFTPTYYMYMYYACYTLLVTTVRAGGGGGGDGEIRVVTTLSGCAVLAGRSYSLHTAIDSYFLFDMRTKQLEN